MLGRQIQLQEIGKNIQKIQRIPKTLLYIKKLVGTIRKSTAHVVTSELTTLHSIEVMDSSRGEEECEQQEEYAQASHTTTPMEEDHNNGSSYSSSTMTMCLCFSPTKKQMAMQLFTNEIVITIVQVLNMYLFNLSIAENSEIFQRKIPSPREQVTLQNIIV